MNPQILDAFLETRDGYSPDAVVADRELNRRFLDSCREKGVAASAESINRSLLNARKSRHLRGIKSKRVTVRNQDAFRFASEVAVRFLERRDGVSLDHVLCDPQRAVEFDELAGRIASGHSSFEYRWAALGLRKGRRLRPELVSKVVADVEVQRFEVAALEIARIPNNQGIYILHDTANVLYIGEAASLFARLRKHLDHSDNKGFARWLWDNGTRDLHLEVHVLPKETPAKVRKALEAELIGSRKPVFNVAGIVR